MPRITNFFMSNKFTSKIAMNILGFSTKRKMPLLHEKTLSKWMPTYTKESNQIDNKKGKVYLFNDEFTNYNDTDIGIKAIKLLNKLGYEVVIPKHIESGRTFLSKGLVRSAKKKAVENINLLKDIITEETPLIGIEPSAILAFRDEYPDLAGEDLKEAAVNLAKNALLFDEFIFREIKKGNIKKEQFTTEKQHIRLHGHCQQKAIASTGSTKEVLSFPENYTVDEIPSGCCGMAGSFGFEKEHYEVSMKIGGLVLFPEVRQTTEATIISAPGTSCREQIKDGTGRHALHPVEVLFGALIQD